MKLRSLGLLTLPFVAFACGSIAEEGAPPPSPPEVVTPAPSDPSTSTGSPTTTPPSTCAPREIEVAREGASAIPALAVAPCTFLDHDGTGPVLSIVNTLDGNGQVTLETYDRIDSPPRQTDHDQIFGVPPRHKKTKHEYDASGRVLHSWFDEDADGVNESEHWWAFDAAGNEITQGYRWGTDTSVTTRTFTTNKLLLTETTTRTGDETSVLGFTRQADGSPLTRTLTRGTTLESSSVWTYDANHVSTEVEHQPIRRVTTKADAKGNLLEHREDQPKDGVDDYIRQLTYDAQGHLLKDHAFGKNGEKYGELVQVFDNLGRLVEQTRQWGFGQVNGSTTDVAKNTYDACGNITSIKRTQNGAPHSEVTRTFDAAGYLATEEEVRFLPKKTGTRTTQSFDAQGRLVLRNAFTLSGTSWIPSASETRTYDAAGRLVKIETVTTHLVRTETWKHDAKGRLVLHERSPFEASSIVKEELDYACLP